MNPLKGWKMAASFVFIAVIAVLFGYSGRGPDRALGHEPAEIVLPLEVAPAADAAPARQAEPPSNEISEFQQLD